MTHNIYELPCPIKHNLLPVGSEDLKVILLIFPYCKYSFSVYILEEPIISNYTSALLYLKEYKNAILFFNKSLSLDNDPIGRSFTKISISEAYIGLHQFDKAEGELLDALKENANSKVYTYLLLLHVLMKRNVDKELKEFYKNFPSESDDNYLHFVFSNYSRKVPKK